MSYGRQEDSRSINSAVSVTLNETTPLLESPNKSNQALLFDNTSLRREFKWLLMNSLPIIGTYLLQNSFQLASIFTLGHLVM